MGALRTLDFAMTGVDGKDNCQKIVDILALRTIFPLFMKPPKGHKKSGESRAENEGNDVRRSHVDSLSTLDSPS